MQENFKYYHGTSAIFLDSIRQHGLGKINPNIDFKNLDVLKYLFNLSEKHLLSEPEYLKSKIQVAAMVFQTGFNSQNPFTGAIQFLNFRHTGIYMSLSIDRAAIYTCFNRWGSEILEYCVMLINLLKKHKIEISIPSNINLFGIERFIDMEHQPVIIEISDLNDEDLETEFGESAEKVLNDLRMQLPSFSKKEKHEFLQFCNFNSSNPIPTKKLKFYAVDFEGHPKKDNFEFFLTQIF